MTQAGLDAIVSAHGRWLRGEPGGQRADLVAWDPDHDCWLIQAKRSRPPSPAERADLIEWSARALAQAAWVRQGQGVEWHVYDGVTQTWVRENVMDPIGPADGGIGDE